MIPQVRLIAASAAALSMLPAVMYGATFKGSVDLSLRKGNQTLYVEGQSAGISDVILILTNNSNASAKITGFGIPKLTSVNNETDDIVVANSIKVSDTNGCKGSTLAPGGVCAFDLVFDTADNSGVNDGDLGLWTIGEYATVLYNTRPFPIPDKTNSVSAPVTVVDPPTNAVSPEPSGFLFIGGGLLGLGLFGRCRKKLGVPQQIPVKNCAYTDGQAFLQALPQEKQASTTSLGRMFPV